MGFDIIDLSEEKYQSSSGYYQQIEGPAVAKKMLEHLGYDKVFIERVCYLIAHQHTYDDIKGLDYQILVEGDFLVNIDEDQVERKSIESIRDKIFKTSSGLNYLNQLYLN